VATTSHNIGMKKSRDQDLREIDGVAEQAKTAIGSKAPADALLEPMRKHSYYYDDAHGYEEYDPKKEDNDADEYDD
jgi:hypothetical protein